LQEEEYGMKSNRWTLITALLPLLASCCFAAAATTGQAEKTPKVLFCIAALCFLVGGIGFLCTYIKSKKKT
jgi:drug/metabolite transporter (DMT)-like permease